MTAEPETLEVRIARALLQAQLILPRQAGQLALRLRNEQMTDQAWLTLALAQSSAVQTNPKTMP
jgi:hypothetical protein